MGTGYSLDSNEYRSAATAIEGYGAQQADHGQALASGTSTPLSSTNTGIAGAISAIAQGTVQKIVTDVTSTTQGFANDTAKGLRTQAANADQLEADLVSHAKSILNDPQSAVFGSGGFTSSALSGSGGGAMTSLGTGALSSGSLSSGALSSNSAQDEEQLGEGSNAESEAGTAEAGVLGQEESQESATAMPMMGGGMRGAAGAASSTEERGQRPGYLKSKTEITEKNEDRTKTAIAEHLKECGVAPIAIGPDRLVCAKCGSIVEVPSATADALAN
jgi:hypothetical protein